MDTTQTYAVMDFMLKKKQTIPEFITSDMRVIRFTLIFYYPTPFHITSDLTSMPRLPIWTVSITSHWSP